AGGKRTKDNGENQRLEHASALLDAHRVLFQETDFRRTSTPKKYVGIILHDEFTQHAWSRPLACNDGLRAGVSLCGVTRHARSTAVMAAWKAAPRAVNKSGQETGQESQEKRSTKRSG